MNEQTPRPGIIRRIISAFSRPVYEDPELNRQVGLVYPIFALVTGINLIMMPTLVLLGTPLSAQIVMATNLVVEMFVLRLLKRGQVKRAGQLQIWASWFITTMPAFVQGGITSPFALFTMLWVSMAGLLLERRYLWLMLILNAIEITLLLAVTQYDLIPPLICLATPIRYWFIMMAVLVAAGILIQVASSAMRQSLEKANQTQNTLEQTNRELEGAQRMLEARVVERTAALERSSKELQGTLDVLKGLASINETDQLLDETAHLLSEHFDFYQVLVLMLDERGGSPGGDGSEAGQQLILRAANTETGKGLAASNFSIQLDQPSIATTAVRTRRPYLASDVTGDLLYMAMEEFPDTRSELAVPLIAEGKLLGVLDLQSTQPSAFTDQDLNIIQTMANQIAVNIQNTEVYSQNQQTLESLQRAYTSLSQEGWQNLLRAQPDFGFRAGSTGAPAPVRGEWQPEMQSAADSGHVVQTDALTLAVPIKIRNQVTGVIRMRKPVESTPGNPSRPWSSNEIELVETLSDRLSAAMESARLYEETRRRAERERLTGEITARMRASNDPQAILQIAARELRKALQADKTQLVIQAMPAPNTMPPGDEEGTATIIDSPAVEAGATGDGAGQDE